LFTLFNRITSTKWYPDIWTGKVGSSELVPERGEVNFLDDLRLDAEYYIHRHGHVFTLEKESELMDSLLDGIKYSKTVIESDDDETYIMYEKK